MDEPNHRARGQYVVCDSRVWLTDMREDDHPGEAALRLSRRLFVPQWKDVWMVSRDQ